MLNNNYTTGTLVTAAVERIWKTYEISTTAQST